LSTTFINHAAIEFLMTLGKTTYGIVAITTIVLMFATTIASAINSADARVDQRNDPVNQRSEQRADQSIRDGLVNAQIGNVGVNVAIPANACVICS
jgi:hypothetical protein